MDFILNLFLQYLIPMILVGVVVEIIKSFVLNKFIKKDAFDKTVYELILIAVSLVVSAGISFPFCFIDKVFSFPEYIKTVLICGLLAGKVYDVIKKKYLTPEVTNVSENIDVDKK